MPQSAASKIGAYGLHVCVVELVEGMDCGVRGFAVDRWDCGVFEALDKIIYEGGLHGGVRNN